jgi:Zn-dependent metalloprotease
MRFYSLISLSLLLATASANRKDFTIPNTRSGEYHSVTSEEGFTINSAAKGTPEEIALAHLETLVPGAELQLHEDTYTDEDTGITHLYFTQMYDGFKVENAVANVNLRADGSVLSAGTSLVKDIAKQIVKRAVEEVVEPLEALETASDVVGYNIKTDDAEVVEENPQGNERSVEISNLKGVVEGVRKRHSEVL